MRQLLRSACQALLDLLFPPHCAGCGQWGALLCARCEAAIAFISPPVCPLCGRPEPTASRCFLCRREPPPLAAIRSAALFEGPVRQAIYQLKYRGRRELARPLGMLMAKAWPARLFEADCLIPVPLHPERERERGFNQAHLLAEVLSVQVGLPMLPGALRRVRPTRPQVQLEAAARRENVRGAFAPGDLPLRGRRPVLVDDVCTTTATLGACAEALRRAGVERVWAFTLARAPWDPARPRALPDRTPEAR